MENSHMDKVYYDYNDFHNSAKQNMTFQNYTYYASGANDQISLNRNRHAIETILFNARVLRNVSKIDTTITVLGEKISMPICIAPTAMHKLAHPEGEKNSTKAAFQNKIVYSFSTLSTSTIAEVAKATDYQALVWYQLYVKDRQQTQKLIKQVEENKFKAIVVTVDAPKLGKRIGDERNKFSLDEKYTLEVMEGQGKEIIKSEGEGSKLLKVFASQIDATLNFQDIEWLKTITKLPIILKGIQSYKDAKKCAQAGVHVWVSNHGARQLDTVRGTIEMLEECVQAVKEVGNPNIEIYVDGGVRRGSDAVKFLALGAKCVFIGRGIIFANATEGLRGINKYLDIVRKEFVNAMKLVGATNISQLNKENLIKQTLPLPNL